METNVVVIFGKFYQRRDTKQFSITSVVSLAQRRGMKLELFGAMTWRTFVACRTSVKNRRAPIRDRVSACESCSSLELSTRKKLMQNSKDMVSARTWLVEA